MNYYQHWNKSTNFFDVIGIVYWDVSNSVNLVKRGTFLEESLSELCVLNVTTFITS